MHISAKEQFWKNYFGSYEPHNCLEADFITEPGLQAGSKYHFSIDEKLSKRLLKLAKGSDPSIYMLLLTGFMYTLTRMSNRREICIAVPALETDKFNQLVPFLFQANEELSFRELVETLSGNFTEVMQYSEFNFDTFYKEQFSDYQAIHQMLYGFVFSSKQLHPTRSADMIGTDTNLFISCQRQEERISFDIYASAHYSSKAVKNLMERYEIILANCLDFTNQAMKGLPAITEDEFRLFWPEKAESALTDQCVHHIFERHAAAKPEEVAIYSGDVQITYEELNKKANQLAAALIAAGVGPNTVVPIIGERSSEFVAAVLGILKAGGAYLPIEYKMPAERIQYMLEDANADVILYDSRCVRDRPDKKDSIRHLIAYDNEFPYKAHNPDRVVREHDMCAVLYTSGSSGNPKGIVLEHKGLMNAMTFLNENYWSKPLTLLLKNSISFDFSMTEIFGWMLSGGALVIAWPGSEMDPEQILEQVHRYHISHLNMVTAALQAFVKYLEDHDIRSLGSIKQLFTGGEALTKSCVNKYYQQVTGVPLINLYGPTEATIFITAFDTTNQNYIQENRVPIGMTISRCRIMILDDFMRLQPPGAVGRIYVSGASVSSGYLNKPDLTSAVFIKNPHVPGEILYNTGDMGRWLDYGCIDFLGRQDAQIKLRGYRIEAGEVEDAIKACESISQAYVMVRKMGENSYLCAYVVAAKHCQPNEKAVRDEIKKWLPSYMIPNFIVFMDQLPLTSGGKIAIRLLPDPVLEQHMDETTYSGELYSTLIRIYEKSLGVQGLQVDSCFLDVGGNSLNALTIVAEILVEFSVKIPLPDFYKCKTIADIADYIAAADSSVYSKIEICEPADYYAASAAQQRIYTLNQMFPDNINYNMPQLVRLKGAINKEKIVAAFEELVRRHESFRTSFTFVDNLLVQIIHDDLKFAVDYMELDPEDNIMELVEDFISPFHLDQAPLLRIILVKANAMEYYLMIDMHHIISDGTSMGIVIDEFIQLYQDKPLKPLEIQYKDFAAWQNRIINSPALEKEKKYWLDCFSGTLPKLEIPTDYPRTNTVSHKGCANQFELKGETAKRIYQAAQNFETTPYIYLFAVYFLFLSKLTNQDDLIVAYPTAGRVVPETDKVIGMFVNTLPMRIQTDGNQSFVRLLEKVKQRALEMHENQNFQLDALVEALNITRDAGRNVLFDTMFSLRDTYFSQVQIGNTVIENVVFEEKNTKFDLYYNVEFYSDRILFDTVFRECLYREETVVQMNRHYQNLILRTLDNPYEKQRSICMLSKEEKAFLLDEMNDTATDYPRNKALHEIFEELVRSSPQRAAIEMENKTLNYKELNALSNSIAQTILDRVGSGQIVAIVSDTSIHQVAAVLAILKTGGIYLPIDPEYPDERIQFILNDCNVSLVLAQKAIGKNLFAQDVLFLEDIILYEDCENLPPVDYRPEACIIYTSGSTGKPKGALLTQYSICRVVMNTNYVNIIPDDILMQLSSFTFDGSIFAMYGALLNGAKLVLVSKKEIMQLHHLSKTIVTKEISMFFVTTQLFNLMVDHILESLSGRKKIFTGGEKPSVVHMNKAVEFLGAGKLIHMYGPTESTVFTTFYEMNEPVSGIEISIGKPISNTEIYILDQQLDLQAIGVTGELYIGGDGLAMGYVNRMELTNERFLRLPVVENRVLYRTGDLVKMLPNGDLIFIGREDDQIKLKGNRIEPMEIVHTILKYSSVKEAVVLPIGENDTMILAAFLVCDQQVDMSQLHMELTKHLPQYLIPSRFLKVDSIPMNKNGKVDKKKLEQMYNESIQDSIKHSYTDDMEDVLLEIWTKVLGYTPEEHHKSFFQVGGNSLLAIKLNVLIQERFPVVASMDIYAYQTMNEQAAYIRRMVNEDRNSIGGDTTL